MKEKRHAGLAFFMLILLIFACDMSPIVGTPTYSAGGRAVCATGSHLSDTDNGTPVCRKD